MRVIQTDNLIFKIFVICTYSRFPFVVIPVKTAHCKVCKGLTNVSHCLLAFTIFYRHKLPLQSRVYTARQNSIILYKPPHHNDRIRA